MSNSKFTAIIRQQGEPQFFKKAPGHCLLHQLLFTIVFHENHITPQSYFFRNVFIYLRHRLSATVFEAFSDNYRFIGGIVDSIMFLQNSYIEIVSPNNSQDDFM